jgi:hypothetical protein
VPDLVRYTSPDEDSARWWGFPFRPGDIVISTRSKSGTTWMQMICALLVLQTPDLPEPLGRMSPWLDWLTRSQEEIYERLAAQAHRRFIKTHTPLDGVPADTRATYIVVARHPLDAAVSLYHHGNNIDRERMRQLTGAPPPDPASPPRPTWTLHESVLRYIDWEGDPATQLDTLVGTMAHLTDAWSRRSEPNVVLVHYDDLVADLDGAMRALAGRLGVPVDEERWPGLVRAATFDAMRDRSTEFVPDTLGVLKDGAAFFRRGVSGEGRTVLSDDELARYRARAAALAPADLVSWLHRDGDRTG